jgi:hypothetical protein
MPCEKEQKAWQDRSRELANIVAEMQRLEKDPRTGRPGTPGPGQVSRLPKMKAEAEESVKTAKRAYEECMKKAKPKS